MAPLTCPHCGASQTAPTSGQCRNCGRPLSPPGRKPAPDFGFVETPVPGAERAGLGAIPSADATAEDAFDLAAILEPPSGQRSAERRPSGPSFSFGSAAPEIERTSEEAAPDLAHDVAPSRNATGQARINAGWRVRNERGLVYEMPTWDAIVSWLEARAELSGVRVARADGPFKAVEEFPDLAARLGLRSQSAGGDASRLELDTAVTRGRPGSRGPRPAATDKAKAPAAERRKASEPTLGVGFVLWLLVGAGLLAGGAIFVGVQTGFLPDAPPLEPLTAGQPPAPGPALAAALKELEAGRFTAAELQLRKALVAESDDPRVYRHLAAALHQTGRESEARTALAEYRRRSAQIGRK